MQIKDQESLYKNFELICNFLNYIACFSKQNKLPLRKLFTIVCGDEHTILRGSAAQASYIRLKSLKKASVSSIRNSLHGSRRV